MAKALLIPPVFVRLGSLGAVVVIMLAALGAPAATRAADPAIGGGAILFEDDFTGAAGSLPNPKVWGDYGPCIEAKQAYGSIKCGQTERLNGLGQVSIPATPTTGSSMMSKDKFSFKYGVFSAWVKVPSELGYWPAVWMLNDPYDAGGTKLFGEIDVLEYYTFQPQYAHSSGVINWGIVDGKYGNQYSGEDNYCTIPNVTDISKAGYVKYSVRIEPDRITGYINDRQCGKTVYRRADKAWGFAPNVPYENYLILTNAVGGAGGRQPTPTAPSEMLVDRVEVRSLEGDATPTATPASTPTATPLASPTVTPTATPSAAGPDLNSDGKVGVVDLSIFLSGWGKPGRTDFNGDATTDIKDLSVLLAAWSK